VAVEGARLRALPCPASAHTTHTHFPPPPPSLFPPPTRPRSFGQHPNADIQSAILDTADLLGTVLSLQPRAIAGEGARPEDKVDGTCADLQRQLPELFDVEAVIAAVAPRGDPEPLKVVLYQESERYNILLRKMKGTLAALRSGIAGTVVITTELEQLFDALLVGRVPAAWGFAYPSLKPLGLWMRDLLDRLKQLAAWAERGMPACFWLSGFTYPTGMLTAMLQVRPLAAPPFLPPPLLLIQPRALTPPAPRHLESPPPPSQTSARANGLAIDNLEFEYPILTQPPEHLREGPKEGQYIRGLFLEGAQWSKEDACLAEPAPMQLFAPMPVVHFKPIEARRERTRGIYKCPMYLYPVRTGTRERPSYMGVVDLRCAEGVEPSQWIKRGTALLLALAS
jgi:dynein heavy chain